MDDCNQNTSHCVKVSNQNLIKLDVTQSNPSLAQVTPTPAVNEEQIAKQLTDMREQTEFMQKFRVALALALSDIRTLKGVPDCKKINGNKKNTSRMNIDPDISTHNTEGCRNFNGNGSMPKEYSTVEKSKGVDASTCVCSQLKPADFEFLNDFLSKIKTNGLNQETEIPAILNYLPNLSQNNLRAKADLAKKSQNELENCIRQIDKLKLIVADRKSETSRLKTELSKSREIRVKRETKLEEKLTELAELKTKYASLRDLNEKQGKVSRGLKVALHHEKRRVKSSEKLACNLEETKRAFTQLKTQAGELMNTLEMKDLEIADLNEKLEIIYSNGSYFERLKEEGSTTQIHGVVEPHVTILKRETVTSDIHTQTEDVRCAQCKEMRLKIVNVNEKYEILLKDFGDCKASSSASDFSQHFYNAPAYSDVDSHNSDEYMKHLPIVDEKVEQSQSSNHRAHPHVSHGHPYGRRNSRIYPSYTSPVSYSRVSRPPLRRRLHYEERPHHHHHSHHGHGGHHKSNTFHNVSVDTLLSPIDESGEIGDDALYQNRSTVKQTTPVHPFPTSQLNHSIVESPREKGANGDGPHGAHEIHGRIHHHHEPFHSVAQWPPGGSPHHLPKHPQSPKNLHDSVFESAQQHKSTHIGEHSGLTHTHHVNSKRLLPSPETTALTPIKETDAPSGEKIEKQKSAPMKATYLEVGANNTPSPSKSKEEPINVVPLIPSPISRNSFFRNASHESTENGLFSDIECDNPKRPITPCVTETRQFGFMWHPAIVDSTSSSPNKVASDNHHHHNVNEGAGSATSSNNSSPRSSRSSPGRNNDVMRSDGAKVKKSHDTSSRHVMYKGHRIDVTRFTIHAFRDIVWTLEGGSDDFISFLACLATKLNDHPKWKDKHALGDAKDWLELRGLY